jgi:hypothetical protein
MHKMSQPKVLVQKCYLFTESTEEFRREVNPVAPRLGLVVG